MKTYSKIIKTKSFVTWVLDMELSTTRQEGGAKPQTCSLRRMRSVCHVGMKIHRKKTMNWWVNMEAEQAGQRTIQGVASHPDLQSAVPRHSQL